MKSFEFKDSPVHGKGIFALVDIPAGTELFQTHVMDSLVGKRSPAAMKPAASPYPAKMLKNSDNLMRMWINIKPNHRYNHSTKANCSSSTKSDTKYLVTLSDIKKGDELLVDYTKDRDLEQPQHGWVD